MTPDEMVEVVRLMTHDAPFLVTFNPYMPDRTMLDIVILYRDGTKLIFQTPGIELKPPPRTKEEE